MALLPRESLQEVYDGVWGYSAILSSGAIMCVFFAFNGMSFLLGMMNLANTIIIQYALRTTMSIEVGHPTKQRDKSQTFRSITYSIP